MDRFGKIDENAKNWTKWTKMNKNWWNRRWSKMENIEKWTNERKLIPWHFVILFWLNRVHWHFVLIFPVHDAISYCLMSIGDFCERQLVRWVPKHVFPLRRSPCHLQINPANIPWIPHWKKRSWEINDHHYIA